MTTFARGGYNKCPLEFISTGEIITCCTSNPNFFFGILRRIYINQLMATQYHANTIQSDHFYYLFSAFMRPIYRIVYSSLHSYNKRLYTCLSMILRIGIWLPEFIKNDHFLTNNENSYHTRLHP